MSTIDVDALLLEIAGDAPCGPNLEYDPDFVALEQAALGKPEVQYGDTITPALPPDWKLVRRVAASLLERSRDLRLAVHLLRANLALSGVAGLSDGLTLIARLLDERWDSVHPALDPDDDLDPTLRINSLAILADTASLLADLKEAALVMLPGLGPLTIRMLDIASGETAPPECQEKVAIGSIESALADVDPAQLAISVRLLARALASAVHIEALLVRHVGSAQALNLDPLTRPLRKSHDFLARQQNGASAAAAHAGVGVDTGAVEPHGAPRSAARTGIDADVASREDVTRLLDKVMQYYGRYEPSSPIPILLERAKRLVPMNFFEIMQDMAPDGIAQLQVLRGPGSAG